jgi:hypothetical protein
VILEKRFLCEMAASSGTIVPLEAAHSPPKLGFFALTAEWLHGLMCLPPKGTGKNWTKPENAPIIDLVFQYIN